MYFNWCKMWAYLAIIPKLASHSFSLCLLYFNRELPWYTHAPHFVCICPQFCPLFETDAYLSFEICLLLDTGISAYIQLAWLQLYFWSFRALLPAIGDDESLTWRRLCLNGNVIVMSFIAVWGPSYCHSRSPGTTFFNFFSSVLGVLCKLGLRQFGPTVHISMEDSWVPV